MNICKSDVYFIILLGLIIYIFYELRNLKKENFAVQDDVKAAINEVYQADVDAIRNLSAVAKKLQEGGLTSAGNLTVAGELYVNNWLRVRGNQGIYFEDRGGGWHMTDNDWIRSFNGKNVYCDKQLVGSYVRSDSDLQVNGNSKVNGQSETGGNLLLSGANTWMLHTPDDGRKTLYFGKGKDGAIDDWPITFDEDGTINCRQIRVGNITIRDNNIDFGDHWGGITTEGGIIYYYQRHSAGGGNMNYRYHGAPARRFCQVGTGILEANDNWNNWRKVGSQ